MTREELIASILELIHGDADSDDTDIGISVTDICNMDINELQDLYDKVTAFGDHLDNI